MKPTHLLLFLPSGLLLTLFALVQAQPGLPGKARTGTTERIAAVDVTVDTGREALGAYQLVLTAKRGRFKILSIEGGEHPAFAKTPYFDPAALGGDRVVLAAFSTDQVLPTGTTRVARVHVACIGGDEPAWIAQVQVCATANGRKIPATAGCRVD